VYSQHDDIQTALRYRPAIDGGDPNYLPTTTAYTVSTGYSYPSSNSAIEQFFYMGGDASAANGHATESPGFFNRPGYGGPTLANITTYNYTTGTWNNTQIHMDSLLFATGGLTENLQDSKTLFYQGFFWNDRIILSGGINDDQVKNRNTVFPVTNPTAIEYTNGMPNPYYWYAEGPWNDIGGNTSTEGMVIHGFKDWAAIDHAADRGGWEGALASVLRTLSFTFNKSNNFNPPPAYYTDLFGNSLGKPTGTEKDYGLEIATPDNKFFLRATWFTTTNQNALTTFTSTGRATYIDHNELQAWATDVVEIRNGESPSDPNFGNTNVYPITQAMQNQISALTGLPYTFGGNVGSNGEYINPNGTENGTAKGAEIELTYNPLPNWTMKLTWGRQQTIVSGAAAQAQAYVNYRYPTWQTYKAPDMAPLYTLYNGNLLSLQNFWQGYGFSDVTATSASGWTTVNGYYQAVLAGQLATDEAVNGSLAPNQREYSWAYLTNYTIPSGMLRNVGIGGAVNYDGEATVGYWGNPNTRNGTNQIAGPNILQPIYTPGKFHIDAWLAYKFKLPSLWSAQKLWCTVQFNMADITSSGYLLPVSYNWNGTPAAMRIIPPRSFNLTTKFQF
jgi:hypothetical protein